MDLSDKEEVAAPTVEEAVQEVVAPPVVVAPAASAKSGAKCTRDTRGEADCDVKDCENCN